MVIPFVVPEILGGGVEPPPPHMPLSCQKRQMPLTVKDLPNFLHESRGQQGPLFEQDYFSEKILNPGL